MMFERLISVYNSKGGDMEKLTNFDYEQAKKDFLTENNNVSMAAQTIFDKAEQYETTLFKKPMFDYSEMEILRFIKDFRLYS